MQRIDIRDFLSSTVCSHGFANEKTGKSPQTSGVQRDTARLRNCCTKIRAIDTDLTALGIRKRCFYRQTINRDW